MPVYHQHYWPRYERYYLTNYGPYYGIPREKPPRTDEEISQDVQNSLFWDTWVDTNRVSVAVKQGVVTLTGEVNSHVSKRSAGDDAWDVPGVADVDNRLVINRHHTPNRAAWPEVRPNE